MPVRAYNTRVLVDGFDFSQDTKGVTLSFTVAELDASTLQSASRKVIAGADEGTVELSGYYDGPGVGTIEREIQARLGSETPCVVAVLLDTTALGNPAYVQQQTWGKQMKIDAPIDDLLTLDAAWTQITSRGLAVAHQAFAALGAAPVIDFGAAGAAGGWAALFVRAITGTAANATFVVKSSAAAGFTSPATHGTFTVTAKGALLLAFSGAVGRYVRLECTSLGGATSLDVTAVAGVAGVTE